MTLLNHFNLIFDCRKTGPINAAAAKLLYCPRRIISTAYPLTIRLFGNLHLFMWPFLSMKMFYRNNLS